ncbi:YsnF/AvaK domain-containing protein [Pseudomonas luteola]|uniref:YsnF/AvaK domain-containing protein n=1 Tax=Pseudomonas TaxID=286 RepID=UPI00389115F0
MNNDQSDRQATETIPIVEERAELHKETVESGRVQINKTVESKEYTVSDALRYEETVIERVKFDTPVDPAHLPQVRQDGDVTIIPVFEEVLVVEKRLMLKEELHVQRVTREAQRTVPVTLKRENVTVERSHSHPESDHSGSAR